MAEFSKQYNQIWGLGLEDFDIEEIANRLQPEYYESHICEGFGFTAIGKDKEGKITLFFPDWNTGGDTGKWKDYDTVISNEIEKAKNYTE